MSSRDASRENGRSCRALRLLGATQRQGLGVKDCAGFDFRPPTLRHRFGRMLFGDLLDTPIWADCKRCPVKEFESWSCLQPIKALNARACARDSSPGTRVLKQFCYTHLHGSAMSIATPPLQKASRRPGTRGDVGRTRMYAEKFKAVVPCASAWARMPDVVYLGAPHRRANSSALQHESCNVLPGDIWRECTREPGRNRLAWRGGRSPIRRAANA